MKRVAIALAAALLFAGATFAQSAPAPQKTPGAQASQLQLTSVSGKLELIQGVIGLKAEGKTYLAPGLRRVAGFIKGVEEGGAVTVEGYARALPYTSDVIMLRVTKLTVNGKDYDLSQPGGDMRENAGPMMQGDREMRGGRW